MIDNETLINDTIEKLQLDSDFVLKHNIKTGKPLTARNVIELIVNDRGNSLITAIFKGHCQSKIREILNIVFYEFPRPSSKTRWYGHVLTINGLKKCPHCGQIKSMELFSNNKAMKSSGKDSWCLSCMKERRILNSDHLKVVKALWQKNNKQRAAAAAARRRARKILAEPRWRDLYEIYKIYANCPDGYHVDHWAPLAGTYVCGLHVHYNLQYMPAALNIGKSNKFSETDTYREFGP